MQILRLLPLLLASQYHQAYPVTGVLIHDHDLGTPSFPPAVGCGSPLAFWLGGASQ